VNDAAPSLSETQPTLTASEKVAAEAFPATTVRRPPKKPRIPKLKKWTLVLVTWLDAVSFEDPQHSDDDDFSCPTRNSVGHFIRRTQEAITLAMEDDRGLDSTSDCDSVTSIPVGMIRKVAILVEKQ
jgi:hypothetical protein